jgi:alpha-beta hydrolase superfamily lysophospholipase
MSAPPPWAAVLLHGLPLAEDRFADLEPLAQDLSRAGFHLVRFRWPESINPIRALIDRNRSFSAELAAELDVMLRQQIAAQYTDQRWIIVAHSGGGTIFYRWLLEHSARFYNDYSTRPAAAFIFASLYKCEMQRIKLPDGPVIQVREPALSPDAIATAMPNNLVIFTTPRDTTVLAMDSVFPPGKATHHIIENTTHRDICSNPVARFVVWNHVRRLLSSQPTNPS